MVRLVLLAVLLTGCCALPSTGATVSPVDSSPTTAPTTVAPTTEIGTAIVGGVASWYRWHPGEAAASKFLRELIGKDWRGERVRVCYREACTVVTLTDAMSHPTRLIDLDVRSFAALAHPDKGLLQVQVTLP